MYICATAHSKHNAIAQVQVQVSVMVVAVVTIASRSNTSGARTEQAVLSCGKSVYRCWG